MTFHTAKNMLKAAQRDGLTIQVWGDDGGRPDYSGPSAKEAWKAVKETALAEIVLLNNGSRVTGGWAHVMADGPYTCTPQETIVDCSASGWMDAWWQANEEQILA